MTLEIIRLMSTHLLFDLQLVHNWGKLRQNLVSLLVVFELGSDEVGEVAEGLGGIEDLRLFSNYPMSLASANGENGDSRSS